MLGPQPRISEIYLGLIALGLGALFLFWSSRGLIAYSAGSKAESADPILGVLGLIASAWMLVMSWRLLRGSKHRNQLMSRPALLVLSLAAVAGGLWVLGINQRAALGFLVIAMLGIARWWSLRPSRSATPKP